MFIMTIFILGVFIVFGFSVGYFLGMIIHYIFNAGVVSDIPIEILFGLIGVVLFSLSVIIKR